MHTFGRQPKTLPRRLNKHTVRLDKLSQEAQGFRANACEALSQYNYKHDFGRHIRSSCICLFLFVEVLFTVLIIQLISLFIEVICMASSTRIIQVFWPFDLFDDSDVDITSNFPILVLSMECQI